MTPANTASVAPDTAKCNEVERKLALAEELVKVASYNKRVWTVTFGSGRDKYQLMYDTGEVAEDIASSLKALVVEAITRSENKHDETRT